MKLYTSDPKGSLFFTFETGGAEASWPAMGAAFLKAADDLPGRNPQCLADP